MSASKYLTGLNDTVNQLAKSKGKPLAPVSPPPSGDLKT